MKLTTQIICDIIKTGLALKDDQVWIYNQRRSIPEDERMYVVVGMSAIKPYASNNRQTTGTNYMNDNTAQYMQEMITIDVLSYTTEAIERYTEIFGALISTYSQQHQEALGLKIAALPTTVNDVSEVEGAAILYRIAITLNVLRKYDMLIAATYYDTFEAVDVSKHQP